MAKTYVGIDNGVSGSCSFLKDSAAATYYPTPIFRQLNYTKTKAYINRVDTKKLKAIFLAELGDSKECLVVLERCMVNPGRFKATISAVRAMEATLIVLEDLGLPYVYMDSKEWQRELLPTGCVGDELKTASSEVGKRLFPHLKDAIKKDADALLMAEHARRKKL